MVTGNIESNFPNSIHCGMFALDALSVQFKLVSVGLGRPINAPHCLSEVFLLRCL